MLRRLRQVVLAALALAAAITWLPLHAWDDEARVIDRERPDQQWIHKGKTPDGLSLVLARETSTASGAHDEQDPAAPPAPPFACERIWILERSSSRLTQTIGLYLQDRLLEVPGLTEVAYFPRSDQPLAIVRPPDLFVVLDAEVERDLPLPFFHDLRVAVTARVSRHALEHGPSAGPRRLTRATFASRRLGLVSSFARYDRLAQEVHATLALEDWIARQRAAFGIVPTTPLEVVGQAGATPRDLPLELSERDRLYSQADFAVQDETVWSLAHASRRDAASWMTSAAVALGTSGWAVAAGGTPDEPVVTATRGDRELSLALEPDEVRPGVAVLHRRWQPAADVASACAAFQGAGGAVEGLVGAWRRLPAARRAKLRGAWDAAGLTVELGPDLGGD